MTKTKISLALLLTAIVNFNVVSEATDYTSIVQITDGQLHDLGDITITPTTGPGLSVSAGTVIVGTATITTQNSSGFFDGNAIVAGSSAVANAGDVLITLGETHLTATNYGIVATTLNNQNYKTIVKLGDNSTINSESLALNIQRNSHVEIGNYATIIGQASGSSVAATEASNGATIFIGDNASIGNIGTNGNNHAILAWEVAGSSLTGAKITIGNDATIYTTATNATNHAVMAGYAYSMMSSTYLASGRVEIGDNATITTKGSTSYGVFSQNNSSIILGNGTAIETSGANSSAVRSGTLLSTGASVAGGTINIGDELQITTTGQSAYGLDARYAGSVINVKKDALIQTTGTTGYGVYADTSGSVSFNDGAQIITTGVSGYGVYVTNSGSVSFNDGTQIKTTGNAARGVYALSGGKVTLGDNAIITTFGNTAAGGAAYGVQSSSANTVVEIGKNALIQTEGASGHGVYADNSGSVLVGEGSQITTKSDSTHGVYALTSGNVQLTDTTIVTTGATSHGIYTAGNSSTTINGGTIEVDDSKGSMAIYTAGTGNVEGAGVYRIKGDIMNANNGEVDLDFKAGSQFIGGSNAGAGTITFAMRDSSDWIMTKNSNLTNLDFFNGGTVSFNTDNTYGALTVSHLQGNGGIFSMRTDIVGDGAGGNIGDFLEVTGTSAGDHLVTVQNNGSANATGDETLTIIRTADGIAQFQNTNVVELGGYEFNLRDVAGSNQTEWELYGTKKATTIGSAAVNLFAGSYLLNYAETMTLMKRMGDLRDGEHNGNVWGRIFGGKFHSDSDRFLKDFEMTYTGIQVGADKKFVRKDGRGVAYLGGFFGYTKGDLDYGQGSGDVDSKSLGAYWTHMHHNGFYADAVLKYGWMKNDFNVLDSQGIKVTGDDISTHGFTGSLEVGRRYHLDQKEKKGWYIEPQTQLTISHQSGDRFTASNGLRIKVDSFRSVLGRVGTHLGYEVKDEKNPINIYGKVSVVKEFDGDVSYSFNGSPETTSYKDTWLVYGVGATAKIGTRHNLYLDVERATGGQFTQSWAVTGGYRYNW